MICDEVRDAIDAARSVSGSDAAIARKRHHSFQTVRAIVLAVVQELPDGMTVAELRDELQISENQWGADQ